MSQQCRDNIDLRIPDDGMEIGLTNTGYALMLHPDGVRVKRQEFAEDVDPPRRRNWFGWVAAVLLLGLMLGTVWLTFALVRSVPTWRVLPTATAVAPTLVPTTVAATPVPTSVPTPVPTVVEPGKAVIGVLTANVNVRRCPDLKCEVAYIRLCNERVVVVDVSREGLWLKLIDGNWVYRQYVRLTPP